MSGGSSSAPLVAFYGDDFTGSTDVMEVLEFSGIPTVLFMDIPTAEQRRHFRDRRGVGIAGVARGQSPQWMDEHLPRVFESLKSLRADITQYKICSTFDSAADVGNIGRAAELGLHTFASPWIPMVIGAPRLRRYQVFGNVFAQVDGTVYRLDRHPTMSCHPVTPMREADVRLHLSQLTELPVGVINVLDIAAGRGERALASVLDSGAKIVAFDVLNEQDLRTVGELIWQTLPKECFSVSSSGLEYALTSHWRASGSVADQPSAKTAAPCKSLLVVSGSCSPTTSLQIRTAVASGAFTSLRADAVHLVDPTHRDGEIRRSVDEAERVMQGGGSPIVYSADGPRDASIDALRAYASDAQLPLSRCYAALGQALGEIAKTISERCEPERIVICGGDTSGYCARALQVYALTAKAPLAPGSPLCDAYRQPETRRERFELVLKGGQVGGARFFEQARTGAP